MELAPGARGVWNKERKQATCEPCVNGSDRSEINRGRPGESAGREANRRGLSRDKRVMKTHPRIGKTMLALTEDPQSTQAWTRGAEGERALGVTLESLRDEGFGVLHDRRIPGGRANIDHLVVGPAGVFVIDAKRYRGKVERRNRGSLLARDWRLYVNGRDRSSLVNDMARQVEAVRLALARSAVEECRVVPVLCFVDSQWALMASPFVYGDVRVVWPKMLGDLVRAKGKMSARQIRELERLLANVLPPA